MSEVTITVVDNKNKFHKKYLIGDAGQIACDFDLDRQFLIYVPGFTSQYFGYPAVWVSEAMRSVPDVYYVFVDYSMYSKVKITIENLQGMIPYVYYIGKAVGELLANHGFIAENIHLVAHSTGSHIIGNIAQTYTALTGCKIRRFTSVDPSAPCFQDARPREKVIKPGVAEYVEVLHCTNAGVSTITIKGDTDYFFNWDKPVQPGCYEGITIGDLEELTADLCGHYYCMQYWANTVINKDLYEGCGSWDGYCSDDCDCPDTCGYHRPCEHGNFYVNTEV